MFSYYCVVFAAFVFYAERTQVFYNHVLYVNGVGHVVPRYANVIAFIVVGLHDSGNAASLGANKDVLCRTFYVLH